MRQVADFAVCVVGFVVSRDGVSDLGANAKRVRSFLADLAGTNPAG